MWLIHFVDGKNHRHTGYLSVVDGFFGLRHDAVVSRNHDNRDIGNLSTTSSHRGKSLVTRSIQECDLESGPGHHIICANVLGDPSGFGRSDLRHSNVIEQGSLTV